MATAHKHNMMPTRKARTRGGERQVKWVCTVPGCKHKEWVSHW